MKMFITKHMRCEQRSALQSGSPIGRIDLSLIHLSKTRNVIVLSNHGQSTTKSFDNSFGPLFPSKRCVLVLQMLLQLQFNSAELSSDLLLQYEFALAPEGLELMTSVADVTCSCNVLHNTVKKLSCMGMSGLTRTVFCGPR